MRDLLCAETFGWDKEQIGRQPALWLSDLMTAYAEKQRISAVLARQPLKDHQAAQREHAIPKREQVRAFAELYDAPPEAFDDLL